MEFTLILERIYDHTLKWSDKFFVFLFPNRTEAFLLGVVPASVNPTLRMMALVNAKQKRLVRPLRPPPPSLALLRRLNVD